MQKIILALFGVILAHYVALFSIDYYQQIPKTQKNTIKAIFTHIYKHKLWGNEETLSGTGSTLKQTTTIRAELPTLFKKLNIHKILDAPCGDCNWISTLDLANYIYMGVDIVPEIIAQNKKKFTKPNMDFRVLNVIHEALPKADIIICRDLFIHFPNRAIIQTLKNFKQSGSHYLLTTTYPEYPGRELNQNIYFGQWKPVDLEKAPFSLPKPLAVIHEQATDNFGKNNTKCLALWDLTKLKI